MKVELVAIQDDVNLKEAIELVESLMASTTVDDIARLRAQAQLIQNYERNRWPSEAVSVPQLLTYLMHQHNMTRADLVPFIGSLGRVSEVMNGKIGLSMTMVRRLRDRFGISADLLISASGSPR